MVGLLVVIALIFGRRDSGAPSQITLAVLLLLWLLSDLVEWRNESLVVTTQRVSEF